MSENIKHECGIAMVRLLKPLEYYQQKYGSAFWGLNKMYLLMEKQHNRGQDGAGIAAVKIDAPVGRPYIDRVRSKDPQSILEVFKKVNSDINRLMASRPKAETPQQDLEWIRENIPFASDIYLGHVRYGTYGGNTIEAVHPFMRENITAAKTLVVAGNFNMTNVDFLYNRLVEMGTTPSPSWIPSRSWSASGTSWTKKSMRSSPAINPRGCTEWNWPNGSPNSSTPIRYWYAPPNASTAALPSPDW